MGYLWSNAQGSQSRTAGIRPPTQGLFDSQGPSFGISPTTVGVRPGPRFDTPSAPRVPQPTAPNAGRPAEPPASPMAPAPPFAQPPQAPQGLPPHLPPPFLPDPTGTKEPQPPHLPPPFTPPPPSTKPQQRQQGPTDNAGAPAGPPPTMMTRVPNDDEFAALAGQQIMTPWGPIVPDESGRPRVMMDEAGRAAFTQAKAAAIGRFGAVPGWAQTPGAAPPPVEVGRANFNPFTGQWTGVDDTDSRMV